jgi:hypothetical protein
MDWLWSFVALGIVALAGAATLAVVVIPDVDGPAALATIVLAAWLVPVGLGCLLSQETEPYSSCGPPQSMRGWKARRLLW